MQGGDRDEDHVANIEPAGERHELVLDLLEPLPIPVDEIHLVDAHDHVGNPSRRERKAWRRLCSTIPLRASIRIMARCALDAPVTMLRVYSAWPGVSAMMNFRLGVEK